MLVKIKMIWVNIKKKLDKAEKSKAVVVLKIYFIIIFLLRKVYKM